MSDEEKKYYWNFYLKQYSCLPLYLLQKEKEKINTCEMTMALKLKAAAIDKLIGYKTSREEKVWENHQ